MTIPPRPHNDKAAARKVAWCNIGRRATVPMLANTTELRAASGRPTGRLALAAFFWTFVDASEISEGTIRIEGPKGHHFARVLRVRPGERGVAGSNGPEDGMEVVGGAGSGVVGRGVVDGRDQG